jgi:hypothetical protein
MDEQGQRLPGGILGAPGRRAGRVDVHQQHLPDPADPYQAPTGEGVERRRDALQSDHPGGQGGLDLGAAQRGAETARRDLHLGELGHGARIGTEAR